MARRKKKKLFVLDTNVILHDSSCVDQFQEHDVVIPVTVLEELDQFKKGGLTVNFHAREFLRRLDTLTGDHVFEKGVRIGSHQGNLIIRLDRKFHENLTLNFTEAKSDHHILNIAYHLAEERPQNTVILVTKDVNLRVKAKSIGLIAQDYTTDHIKNVDTLYKGKRTEELIPVDVINRLYEPPHEISADEVTLSTPLSPNEFVILRDGKLSALGCYEPFMRVIRRVEKSQACGIYPRNAEQTFALDALLNPRIQLVSLTGKAGTGKTLLALAAALQCRHDYRQILMARPVVPLSNKDLGYLPGDVESKLDPYMQPLFDNLGVIQGQVSKGDNHSPIAKLLEDKKLVISPLAYIRGRSLVNIYFIVDEAQNLTPHEVKTIITRAGERTKIVLTGDIFQIDHPYLDTHSNGLSYLIDKMQGQKLYAHVNLEKGERSELSDLASNLL